MTTTEPNLFNCPDWCVADHIADLAVDLNDVDPFELRHTTGDARWDTGATPIYLALERHDVDGEVGATEINVGDGDITPDVAREVAAELRRLADLAET
jgi:hypothetical protein